MAEKLSRNDAKQWWLRCISCSEASVTQHNRSFGIEMPDLEQSLGLFSGGFLHQGDACGLLHGAVLAAGVQAGLRFPDDRELAIGSAIEAAVRLVREYPEVSGSPDCRGITERDFNQISDRVGYMRSGQAKQCGRLSLAWIQRSHEIIDESLRASAEQSPATPCQSCVVDTVRRIDGLDESHAVALAGCSGGVGLSGNVCGVLAAGVFAISARHYEGRGAKKRDSQLLGAWHETGFNVGLRKLANRLRLAFEERFGGRLCAQIAGRHFEGPADFSSYIAGGGCHEVVDFTVGWFENG